MPGHAFVSPRETDRTNREITFKDIFNDIKLDKEIDIFFVWNSLYVEGTFSNNFLVTEFLY